MYLRQEIFKFFQEKHIKVSLFIQDKIQASDGSIYLDFSGVGPEESHKPGTVILYSSKGEVRERKVCKTVLADRWEEHCLPRNAMTRPLLGANLYAADREKPHVPY